MSAVIGIGIEHGVASSIARNDVVVLVLARLGDAGENAFGGSGFRRQDIFNSPRGVERFHEKKLVRRGGIVKKPWAYLADSRRPRSTYTSALTASSINKNGLAMKSLPPLIVELARLSKSFKLVTKTTGVFLWAGKVRSLLHNSKPFIPGMSTSRKIKSNLVSE